MTNQTALPQVLNIEDILKLLPHRYPFIFVDKILEWEKDASIVGLKNVSISETFFQGHFPSMPIMPGVLEIESMAQTACILALLSNPEMIGEKLPNLTGLDKVKFRKPVVPGDQLILKIKITKKKMGIFKMDARAFVDDMLAIESIMTATFVSNKIL